MRPDTAVLLFDPLKLSKAGLPINSKDPVFVSALRVLLDCLRRESPRHTFVVFLVRQTLKSEQES